jgi:hypothetical protein
MARKLSMLAPDWWDFTTLDDELLNDAARLTPSDLLQLSRKGFKVVFTIPLKTLPCRGIGIYNSLEAIDKK